MMSTAGIKLYSLPKIIICEAREDCDTDETQSSIMNGEEEDRDSMKEHENIKSPNNDKDADDPPAPSTAQKHSDPEAALAENLSELNLGDNHRIRETKKSKSRAVTNSTKSSHDEATAVTIEEKGELPSLYVGRIIGKGGEMIRDLQARSGCHIDVNQNVKRGAPKIITYRGRKHEDIDFAKQLVAMLCEEGATDKSELPLGRATMKQISIPDAVVGRIIGRRGEMIRELQSRSQARIQVDHSREHGGDRPGIDKTHHRKVTITGTENSVAKAEELIWCLTESPDVLSEEDWGDGGARSNSLLYHQENRMPPPAEIVSAGGVPFWAGGNSGEANVGYDIGYSSQQGLWNANPYAAPPHMITEADIFLCDKVDIGHIIGQKGATINDLRRRSNCNIQIDRKECQISIAGSRQGIEMAKRMLKNIIHRGSDHRYAGGRRLDQREEPSFHQHIGNAEQQIGYQAKEPYSIPQYGMPPQQHQHYEEPPMTMYQQQQQPCTTQQAQQQYTAQASSPWRATTATDGQVYYYNQDTLETQWNKPAEMQ